MVASFTAGKPRPLRSCTASRDHNTRRLLYDRRRVMYLVFVCATHSIILCDWNVHAQACVYDVCMRACVCVHVYVYAFVFQGIDESPHHLLTLFMPAPAEGAETSAGDAVGEIANGVSNVSLQSAPPPGRIRVRADDGKTYEVDQFCPHKGADLSRANIVNGLLVCPKHQWRFDLKSGGSCHKGASINAVCVANDW
eukprot:Opistho-2@49550